MTVKKIVEMVLVTGVVMAMANMLVKNVPSARGMFTPSGVANASNLKIAV